MTQTHDNVPPPRLSRGAALQASIDREIAERDGRGAVDTIVLNVTDLAAFLQHLEPRPTHPDTGPPGRRYRGVRLMEGAAFDHSYLDVHDAAGRLSRIQL
jgi:hypothetical protein